MSRRSDAPRAEMPALFPPLPMAPRARSAGLMVLTAEEELRPWDRGRVVRTLKREAGVEPDRAEEIARIVEEQLERAGLRAVPTALVRELVGAELVSLGLTRERQRHARMGVTAFEVGELIRGAGMVSSNPFATAVQLGRRLKRDFALAAVLSPNVAEAHRRGDIHIHDLDGVDRVESLWLSAAGLAARATDLARSNPDALCWELGRMVASTASHVSRELHISGLNLGLAPFLIGASDPRIAAFAAQLTGELSVAGGQVGGPRISAALHWDPPGTTSEPAGEVSQRLALQLLEAVRARAEAGREPISLSLVIGPRFFRTRGHLEVLELCARLACSYGHPSFRFARDEEQTGDLSPATAGPTTELAVLSSVSIDLPRLGFEDPSDEEMVEARMVRVLETAAQAHIERRVFLEDLLARGASGPLGFLTASGCPPLALDEALHPIVACGLEELVLLLTGRTLGEGGAALALGRRLLGRLSHHAEALRRRHKLRFVASGEPRPVPATRFAKLDLRYHGERAARLVKEPEVPNRVRYTAGASVASTSGLAAHDRAVRDGALHAEAGWSARTIVPRSALGDSPAAAARLVMDVYLRSACRELVVEV